MKDVRIMLAHAFEALTAIAKDHDLKSAKLETDDLNALMSDIAKLEELVGEAMHRCAGYVVTTLYAIGKESAPGEYEGFTHGPNPDLEVIYGYGPNLEDGDCLVRIVTGGGVVNYVTESIWLDGEWNETGDELKVTTA